MRTNANRRAVALAGLVLVSVLAGAIVLGGTVTATHGETTRGGEAWNTTGTTAEGAVGPGAAVFQGETGIQEIRAGNGSAADFTHSSSGATLQNPVPEDQPTGVYESNTTDDTLIVRTPRINDFSIRNENGADVTHGTVPAHFGRLTVRAAYNFGTVSDLTVEVREGDELAITDQVVVGDTVKGTTDGSEVVRFPINKSAIKPGRYTIEVSATGTDLRQGDATALGTITIADGITPRVNFDSSEVRRDESATFHVSGVREGDTHLLSVDSSDVDGDATDVFRSVGDAREVGATAGDAYAIVEIEDGEGTGAIDTSELALGTVTLTLHEAVSPDSVDLSDGVDSVRILDDASLDVEGESVTLESPRDLLVTGSTTNVSGTASPGVEEVTLYARDDGDYQRVAVGGSNTIPVTAGEFEVTDVELGDADGQGGNAALAEPGTHRVSLVAGDPGPSLTTEAVARATSDTTQLDVRKPGLEASATIVNGQVAVGDTIDISGTATAADQVRIGMVGPEGTIEVVSRVPVDPDGTFERTNVSIGDNYFGETIAKGPVRLSVVSSGPDGVVGDGDRTAAETIQAYERMNANESLTQEEVFERVRAEDVEDEGSDDRVVQFDSNTQSTDERKTP